MTKSIYDAGQTGRILQRDVLGRMQTTCGQREWLLDVAPAALREFERSALSQFTKKVSSCILTTFSSLVSIRDLFYF